jgi:hypothetical protein
MPLVIGVSTCQRVILLISPMRSGLYLTSLSPNHLDANTMGIAHWRPMGYPNAIRRTKPGTGAFSSGCDPGF